MIFVERLITAKIALDKAEVQYLINKFDRLAPMFLKQVEHFRTKYQEVIANQ